MTSSETGVDHSGDASTHAERLDPYESNRYENLMSGFGGFDSDPDQAEEGVDAIAMGIGGLRENPYDSNGGLKNNDQEDPDTSLAEDSDSDQAEDGDDDKSMGIGGLNRNPYDSNGRVIANEQDETVAAASDPKVEAVTVQTKLQEQIDKRRTEIIKELEDEWVKVNGPMTREMTAQEIATRKSDAEKIGESWDGVTTTLTGKGGEFYFDHAGSGANSVPKQAESRLAAEFPTQSTAKTEAPVNASTINNGETIVSTAANQTVEAPTNTEFAQKSEAVQKLDKLHTDEKDIQKLEADIKSATDGVRNVSLPNLNLDGVGGNAFDPSNLSDAQKTQYESHIKGLQARHENPTPPLNKQELTDLKNFHEHAQNQRVAEWMTAKTNEIKSTKDKQIHTKVAEDMRARYGTKVVFDTATGAPVDPTLNAEYITLKLAEHAAHPDRSRLDAANVLAIEMYDRDHPLAATATDEEKQSHQKGREDAVAENEKCMAAEAEEKKQGPTAADAEATLQTPESADGKEKVKKQVAFGIVLNLAIKSMFGSEKVKKEAQVEIDKHKTDDETFEKRFGTAKFLVIAGCVTAAGAIGVGGMAVKAEK